jgi:hypothetical protein
MAIVAEHCFFGIEAVGSESGKDKFHVGNQGQGCRNHRRKPSGIGEATAVIEGLRQEAGDKLRVTVISPGFVQTNLADSITNPETKAQIVGTMERLAISPDAIARAIAFAIEQPADVDVGEIIVRPTAQA